MKLKRTKKSRFLSIIRNLTFALATHWHSSSTEYAANARTLPPVWFLFVKIDLF